MQGRKRTLGAALAAKAILTAPGFDATATVAFEENKELGKQYVKTEKFLTGSFNLSNDGRLAWDWQMRLLREPKPYKGRKLIQDALPELAAFAVSYHGQYAQGTWVFDNNQEGHVVVQLSVEQTLCYDAVLQSSCCLPWRGPTLSSCANKHLNIHARSVSIDLTIPRSAERACEDNLPRWLE
jgi:hypothetical protein